MICVLDASAVLAVILDEPGADLVIEKLSVGHFSAVNLSETMATLIGHRIDAGEVRRQIDRFDLNLHAFGPQHAEAAAILRPTTKHLGLSLGDRACLALGQQLSAPILTADRRMAEAKDLLGIDIRMIR